MQASTLEVPPVSPPGRLPPMPVAVPELAPSPLVAPMLVVAPLPALGPAPLPVAPSPWVPPMLGSFPLPIEETPPHATSTLTLTSTSQRPTLYEFIGNPSFQ
jgi:hypothetical protein